MIYPRAWPGKEGEPGISYFPPKNKKVFKNPGNMLKELRSQPEGAPTGQVEDNLSIRINNIRNGLDPIE